MNFKSTYIVMASAVMILFCMVYTETYSYFTATIDDQFSEAGNGGTALTTADLKDLVIASKNSVNDGLWIPGDSGEYSFAVTNDSSVAMCFELYWSAVTNTWDHQSDLVYTLKKINSEDVGTSQELVSEQAFPSAASDTAVASTSVASGKTDTYTLTITYKDHGLQNEDMGQSFSGTLSGRLIACKGE